MQLHGQKGTRFRFQAGRYESRLVINTFGASDGDGPFNFCGVWAREYLVADQNQRLVIGPGPTLASYPVQEVGSLSRQTPPQLVFTGTSVLRQFWNRATSQTVYNKPRVSTVCKQKVVGTGLGEWGFDSLPFDLVLVRGWGQVGFSCKASSGTSVALPPSNLGQLHKPCADI